MLYAKSWDTSLKGELTQVLLATAKFKFTQEKKMAILQQVLKRKVEKLTVFSRMPSTVFDGKR